MKTFFVWWRSWSKCPSPLMEKVAGACRGLTKRTRRLSLEGSRGRWYWRHAGEQVDDITLKESARIITLLPLVVGVLVLWSYFAKVTEVSSGQGRVIPASHEQVIESLEGGILVDLLVREGDIVESGQVVAQLDLTRAESTVEESAERYRATLARVARLEAEVNDTPLVFSKELAPYTALLATETKLYQTRRDSLKKTLSGVEKSLSLVRKELIITESLMAVGAASKLETLRLQRQVSELEARLGDIRSEYLVQAREELAKSRADALALGWTVKGRADSLSRLTVRSPVRGIVKDIEITTRGGVIPPNGSLMRIVPIGDNLLIEARISPRDIAYVRPGQPAKVKITAYDYTIYGDLDGQVTLISPDTLRDEVKPDIFYYRVFIRTDSDSLFNKAGARFSIVPGMIATVDIRTGEKTIFDYLMTPLNYAREALRER